MTDRRPAWPWSALDLQGPVPLREVKRAYAARLKAIDRDDPQAFQALQQAFEAARERADGCRDRCDAEGASLGRRPDPWVGRPPLMPEVVPDRPAPPPQAPRPDPAPAPEPSAPDPGAQARDPVQKPPPSAPKAPSSAAPKAPAPAPPLRDPASLLIEDLDTLWDTDQGAARSEFLRRLRAAAPDGTPWEIGPLHRLLSLRLRHLAPDLGDRAEAHLFEGLAARLDWSDPRVHPRHADLLEAQFGWASDGVRLRRRFGHHRSFALVVHALSRSVTTGKPGHSAAQIEALPLRWMALAMPVVVALLGALVLLYSPDSAPSRDTLRGSMFLVVFIVSMIHYAVWFYILRILLPILRLLLRLTRLERPLLDLSKRVAPGLVADLQASASLRQAGVNVLAGLAVIYFQLLPYFG